MLAAFCEGNGVCEQDGEIEISLGHTPIWVRVHESPAAIQVYREVADEVPQTSALNERLHDLNHSLVLHRLVWEDKKVFLRADIPANPMSAAQLQDVLDTFESKADELTRELAEWCA